MNSRAGLPRERENSPALPLAEKPSFDPRRIAPVTVKAGEILQNSIKINDLTPSKEEADASYVLIGVAQNPNGDLYIVRSVVNKFSNELDTMDVLYAINAKKSTAALNAPLVSTPNYRTTISVAQLLDFVNRCFPDILPEGVLRHYGYDARPQGELGNSALYSDRSSAYMDAVNNGDTETVQRMVDEAAKEAGYDTPKLYHGTTAFGFTAFDFAKSDDNISVFATTDEGVARMHTEKNPKTSISERVDITPEALDNASDEQILSYLQEYVNEDFRIIHYRCRFLMK